MDDSNDDWGLRAMSDDECAPTQLVPPTQSQACDLAEEAPPAAAASRAEESLLEFNAEASQSQCAPTQLVPETQSQELEAFPDARRRAEHALRNARRAFPPKNTKPQDSLLEFNEPSQSDEASPGSARDGMLCGQPDEAPEPERPEPEDAAVADVAGGVPGAERRSAAGSS